MEKNQLLQILVGVLAVVNAHYGSIWPAFSEWFFFGGIALIVAACFDINIMRRLKG